MRRQEKTREVIDLVYQQVSCDYCKKDVPPGEKVNGNWNGGVAFYKLSWTRERNGISTASPISSLELCGDCWNNLVAPVLRLLGVENVN